MRLSAFPLRLMALNASGSVGVDRPFAPTELPLDAKAEEIEAFIDVRNQRLRRRESQL